MSPAVPYALGLSPAQWVCGIMVVVGCAGLALWLAEWDPWF